MGEIGNGQWVVRFRSPPTAGKAVALEELIDVLHGCRLINTVPDKVLWRSMSRAGFSVKSCYRWLRQGRLTSEVTARKVREIWSFKFPLKVKAFLWTVYFEKLLTKSRRARWAPAADILCVFCKADWETESHLLITCPLVKTLWSWVSKATGLYVGFSSLEGMWEAGRSLKKQGDRSKAAKISQSLVLAVVWSVWLCRNQVLFKRANPYMKNIWESVISLIQEWGRFCALASLVCMNREAIQILE
ncbi:hypothetical protein QJS10_CPB11g02094 [Acorus calamus]|uniref:Reverse transcriptase zinc-binding domain-containing protein n=1 Tax=Acorus calamus TaxID=4465 RepID=A0AAV9DSW7_ACOCL|nr:hypothetical protein QJS10_CPB11g02094 [Acorus calamus]